MPSATYLLGLAAAVYVTTCLVCAAVRWFHMCRPYNRDPRYYYPGRPFVTGAWLSSLCLLPYVLNPEHPDSTLSEAIDAAGFGSRPTYYSVKSKLGPGQ